MERRRGQYKVISGEKKEFNSLQGGIMNRMPKSRRLLVIAFVAALIAAAGISSSVTSFAAVDAQAAASQLTLDRTAHFAYLVGYPDNTIRPLGKITREEAAVIFYRIMTEENRKEYAMTEQPFTDVGGNRWSNDEIATLCNARIIQGNLDGSFTPEKPITRAEFAVLAARFDKLEEPQENRFPDIENHWAKSYINSAAEKGWIKGYGDGTFRPDHIIIRCEAMMLINEMLDRRVNLVGLHEDTKQWPDNTEDKWYYEIVLEATNTHDYERADKPKSIEKWINIMDNPVW